ncbi:MAG: nitrilase-related carbon-nitrogen hydrolase, partial [Chitinophagales bacterium]
MKIALAQINVHIGNFESNFNKIEQFIQDAKKLQADIILFPELSVCG